MSKPHSRSDHQKETHCGEWFRIVDKSQLTAYLDALQKQNIKLEN